MHDEIRLIDGALTLTASDPDFDWFLIERAEHEGRSWLEKSEHGYSFMTSSRISDADVEGSFFEMQQLAAAIERRESYGAKRCAVEVSGEWADFWSPRNSQRCGRVPLAVADALVALIAKVRKP